MKKIYIILLCSFLLIGCEPTKLANVKSVDDAKIRIDWIIQKNTKYYNDLCSSPRNDDTKNKFYNLQLTLIEIYNSGEKCKNLDYTQQKEVTDYAISKLKSNTSLYKLVDMGTIECW